MDIVVKNGEHWLIEIKSSASRGDISTRRRMVLTHFGMTMLRNKPWEIAKQLSEETGVEVIAARDGMKFELS